MAQRTIVSIHEVDEWGTTGPWVGQGSLVASTVVLVHPPLSGRIAGGDGPTRLRVGILPGEGAPISSDFAEVIDVWGAPDVVWNEDPAAGAVVVVLELRTASRSPVHLVPGTGSDRSREENFVTTAEHLRGLAEKDWSPPEFKHSAFWCLILPGKCRH